MTNTMIAKQAIDDFLTQKIQKTIEKKQRSLKGKFGENDKQKNRKSTKNY